MTRRILRGFAAAAVLIAAHAAALAEDAAAVRVQTAIDALRRGDAPAALEALGTGPEADAISARADLVWVLCDRAYRFDQPSKAGDARRMLACRVYDIAAAAAAAADGPATVGAGRAPGGDPSGAGNRATNGATSGAASGAAANGATNGDAANAASAGGAPGAASAVASGADTPDLRTRWALAEAVVLRERAGPRTGPEPWIRAAEMLQQVHAAKPDDVLPLVYAVSFLLEGACAEPDAAVNLTGRAEALTRAVTDRKQDAPTAAVAIAQSQMWAARALLPVNRKLAREQVRCTFETLKRYAAGKPPILEAATAWNEAVTYGKRSGFVLPERYLTAPRTTLDGALEIELPVSSRWRMQSAAATDDAPAYDYVSQTSPEGKAVRQILFRRYVWGQQYTFEGPNAVGGDNVKCIAQGLQAMFAARVIAPSAPVEAPERKPFNRDLDGYVFEVAGKSVPASGDGGTALRVTGYVVRGHEQACYAILVYDYTQEEGAAPEIEAFVAGISEAKK